MVAFLSCTYSTKFRLVRRVLYNGINNFNSNNSVDKLAKVSKKSYVVTKSVENKVCYPSQLLDCRRRPRILRTRAWMKV